MKSIRCHLLDAQGTFLHPLQPLPPCLNLLVQRMGLDLVTEMDGSLAQRQNGLAQLAPLQP